MKFFVVRFVHYDSDGCAKWSQEHLDYLKLLESKGLLPACGPLVGTPVRSGLLIFSAETREQVAAAINDDPFVVHGLVNELTITEWNPVFGVFASQVSGNV